MVVSVVNVCKGEMAGKRLLDGQPVDRITAYLFHAGTSDDPARLAANAGKSFIGSYVLGMGFTFDDTDTKGVASSLADMQRILATPNDPPYAERIFPYIGGEEVNNSQHIGLTPYTETEKPYHRYVINFGEMQQEEARRWPELFRIVEERMRGTRASHSTAPWWQFERLRGGLYRATQHLRRTFAINCGATPHLGVGVLQGRMVYSHTLAVIAFDTLSAFCALQSRVHEVWARFFGSSMKDDLRYTPSDCFETFPFPPNFDADPTLEVAGRQYYEYRAALMVENNEGLTKTYNRFHDPDERSPKVRRLRELHAAMDRAVLDAYGWADFSPRCDFLLDYEEAEDEEDEGKARRRKKPYRYRWIDEDRDRVLAQLLELNQKRAEEERLGGQVAARAEEAEDEG